MTLAPKLAAAIEDRIRKVGDFGSLKLIIKQGRVSEYETVTSERTPEPA
jgi:hypothetical protein